MKIFEFIVIINIFRLFSRLFWFLFRSTSRSSISTWWSWSHFSISRSCSVTWSSSPFGIRWRSSLSFYSVITITIISTVAVSAIVTIAIMPISRPRSSITWPRSFSITRSVLFRFLRFSRWIVIISRIWTPSVTWRFLLLIIWFGPITWSPWCRFVFRFWFRVIQILKGQVRVNWGQMRITISELRRRFIEPDDPETTSIGADGGGGNGGPKSSGDLWWCPDDCPETASNFCWISDIGIFVPKPDSDF